MHRALATDDIQRLLAANVFESPPSLQLTIGVFLVPESQKKRWTRNVEHECKEDYNALNENFGKES